MERPNVIIVMSDQQRADFCRAEGFALNTMPAVDALAASGRRFRRAYTSSPLCTPARCSLFTGRYPKATRVKDNYRSGADIWKPCPDLIDVLRERGYSINLCGKNHAYLREENCRFWSPYGHHGYLGSRPLGPEERRFDAWLKARGNRIAEEPSPFPAELQQPHRIVGDAIECLRQVGRDPFFLWVSFPEPHNPSQASEPYFSCFDPADMPPRLATGEHALAKGGRWRWMKEAQEVWSPGIEALADRFRATYCGMIRQIDDEVGRLFEHLAAARLLERTIVVFLSDHGDYAFDYGLHGKGVGMPECLVRIPLVVWGAGVQAGVNELDFVSITDLMPTLCEALGVEIPAGVQGRSLWPMLTGGSYPHCEFESVYAEVGVGDLYYEPSTPDEPPLHFDLRGPSFDGLNCVSMSGKQKMVRKGHHKLLFDMMGRGELYDVAADPAELHDLYGRPEAAAVQADLMEELLGWTIRTEDDMPKGLYEHRRHPRNWYRQ